MKLALFFTRGVSLKGWIEKGLFDREKAIYEEHLKRGNFQKIYWITYGSEDKEISAMLKQFKRLNKNIEVLPMPKIFDNKFGRFLYSFLIPIIYKEVLMRVDLLKTNQMEGSWSAVLARWLYKKPLILRTGYTASLFVKRLSKSKIKHKIYEWMEKFAYRNSDIAIVASKKDKEFICSKYKINPQKVYVIYNYIDTGEFRPILADSKYKDRLVFIGRLSMQKNLFNLLRAVNRIGLTLDIYGSGPLEKLLKKEVSRLNANVNFYGIVPNKDIPKVLNRYKYFILPSYFEGMPKSLLEAMACGLICIGTNVDGINEIIIDKKTGILSYGTHSENIVNALNNALNLTEDEVEKIRGNAMKLIRTKFSLNICVDKENRIFSKIKLNR